MTVGILIELVATLPVDYIYYASGEYLNWLRLLRLLKVSRLPSIDLSIKSRFESYHMYNIVRLMFLFVVASHVSSCILYVIAKSEYEDGGRFDHASMVRFD